VVLSPHHLTDISHDQVADVVHSYNFQTIDALAICSYAIAFFLNILSSGVDSELTYALARDRNFYSAELPSGFREKLAGWHAMNGIKCAALLFGWFAVSCDLAHNSSQQNWLGQIFLLAAVHDEGVRP
jgi:hypothetical protein